MRSFWTLNCRVDDTVLLINKKKHSTASVTIIPQHSISDHNTTFIFIMIYYVQYNHIMLNDAIQRNNNNNSTMYRLKYIIIKYNKGIYY